MNRRQFLLQTGKTAAGIAAGGVLASQTIVGSEPQLHAGPAGSAPIRLAIVGLQHGHIFAFADSIKARSDVKIVACCEEDPVLREEVTKSGRLRITHTDYRKMLREVGIDVVAVGEWYGKRGRVVIDSLASGRHVISDKPLCTTLADYEQIDALVRTRKLAIGLMLGLRDSGLFIKMRELVRDGVIGDIREISVGAQHPLLPGRRPHWYDEPGKHGGTINDIGVHAFDLIPWVTGVGLRRVVAARGWKTSGVPANSSFVNAGQAMLELENGAGFAGSFSYVSPTSTGYRLPMYWRVTIWGSGGVIEGGPNYPGTMLYKEGAKEGVTVPNAASVPDAFFDSFLQEVRGTPARGLTTSDVLRATWVALKCQDAADRSQYNVAL